MPLEPNPYQSPPAALDVPPARPPRRYLLLRAVLGLVMIPAAIAAAAVVCLMVGQLLTKVLGYESTFAFVVAFTSGVLAGGLALLQFLRALSIIANHRTICVSAASRDGDQR